MFNQARRMELAPHASASSCRPGLNDTPATAPFLQQDKARAAFLGNIPRVARRGEEIAG